MSGKSIDELNLSDEPLSEAAPSKGRTTPEDPRGQEWYRFNQDIEDLLATGKVTWAEDILRDIQTTVEKTHRVSDGQRQAVNNIEAAASRPRRDGFRRRYEGYRS